MWFSNNITRIGAEKLREKFFFNYLAKQTTNLLKILNNAEFAINFFLVVPHANKAKTLFAYFGICECLLTQNVCYLHVLVHKSI